MRFGFSLGSFLLGPLYFGSSSHSPSSHSPSSHSPSSQVTSHRSLLTGSLFTGSLGLSMTLPPAPCPNDTARRFQVDGVPMTILGGASAPFGHQRQSQRGEVQPDLRNDSLTAIVRNSDPETNRRPRKISEWVSKFSYSCGSTRKVQDPSQRPLRSVAESTNGS